MAEFTTTLKRLREERGLTQQQLADAVGLQRSYVAMLETGHRNPTLGMVRRLWTFFRESLAVLDVKEVDHA
jgi:transcriptional regulator with XRE-family HTH domain